MRSAYGQQRAASERTRPWCQIPNREPGAIGSSWSYYLVVTKMWWSPRNFDSLWNELILISTRTGAEPECAHDGDHNSVPARPKWAGILISLAMNCLFRQYSCIILRHKQARGGIITRPFDICRWNWRTWPPIRTSDRVIVNIRSS